MFRIVIARFGIPEALIVFLCNRDRTEIAAYISFIHTNHSLPHIGVY